MNPSPRWRITVESEDFDKRTNSVSEAIRIASNMDEGEFSATSDTNECVRLEFDDRHALVLFMKADEIILRPFFPGAEITGNGVDNFFCACCGVALGEKSGMLANCTTRARGFEITESILNGLLPESDEITWVPLRPSMNSHEN